MPTAVICPRCQQSFPCNKADVQQCFCAAADLTAEQRQQISRRYQGCLCQRCLEQLALEIK